MTHRYADAAQWNARYREGDAPWNSGLVSRELVLRLDELNLAPYAALELGCGTGVNARELARRGFEVTAVDIADAAIETARSEAEKMEVAPRFLVQSACALDFDGEFDFLFDRGCYHCVRNVDVEGYVGGVARAARPGAWFVLLTGSDLAPQSPGPPTVSQAEVAEELGPHFEVANVRPFHFQDPGGVDGPAGWSFLLRRK